MTPQQRAERRELVVRLHRAGVPRGTISTRLEVSVRTVERDLRAAGVVAPHRPWTAADHRRAAALIEDGCSLSEVARTLNRPRSVIRRHFPGHGWRPSQTAEYLSTLRGRAA